MFLKFIFFGSLLTFVLANINYQLCDQYGIHFYEQLGCEPISSSGVCPVGYNCPKYCIPKGMCLFKGVAYKIGERVDGSYCNRDFVCKPDENGKGKFETALIIDCFFGPPPDGCYIGGKLGVCCQGPICPTGAVYTCQVGNATYREDEIFTPEGTCYNCVCKKGFRGIFEAPYCERRPCDMELRSASKLEKECAPVYYDRSEKAKCCPGTFLCYEDVLSIDIQQNGINSNDKCKFGNKRFNIGDQIRVVSKVNWGNGTVTYACSCLVPPYLACNN